jgi:RimJ/RimL family protein N-acetyltransferase
LINSFNNCYKRRRGGSADDPVPDRVRLKKISGLCHCQRMDWPTTEPIISLRLLLEPLSVEHAAAMIEVLADPSLYDYTGGEIPSLTVLEKRYATQAVGHSDDGSQWWLNWVVTKRDVGTPVGFVQATVEDDGVSLVADIAWVISPNWQGQGIASEAAQAMVAWLRSHGVHRLTAHIHPDHQASMKVAQNQALHATSSKKDGETRWESQQP